MSTHEKYDVMVIGGGPAGMMAAGRAAERGKRVLLLEKNSRLGAKLSITGGGRCNILNAEEDERVLLSRYGVAQDFLYSAFAQFGMRDTWRFFESRGIQIVVEAGKRAFPSTHKATDVTACMERYLKESDVEVRCGVKVKGLQKEGNVVTGVMTDKGVFTADVYVISTGGFARGETGSSGEGFAWLADLGHTVVPSRPDLVPLVTNDAWVHALSGTTLSNVKITFGSDLSKEQGKFSKKGNILCTHFGVSGPTVLNAAREVVALLKGGSVHASIDLSPHEKIRDVRARVLGVFEQHKNKTLKNILKEIVPPGTAGAIAMHLPEGLAEKKVHSVSKEERTALADMLKAMPLTITGLKGMDWAVISDGGVELAEVDTKTMRSRKYENLYLIGDVLHINRPSGGYSLQLCWTTGYVAGSHI